jgi:hypothetical protein
MNKRADGKAGEEAISAQAEHWCYPSCQRWYCITSTVQQWRSRSSGGEREGSHPSAANLAG